jgi:hypothetical protein
MKSYLLPFPKPEIPKVPFSRAETFRSIILTSLKVLFLLSMGTFRLDW